MRHLFIALQFLALSLMATWPAATAQPVDGGHAKVELIAERMSVSPGETVYFGLKMELLEGWHVYWRNAGDAGLPPELTARETSDIGQEQIGGFVWPIPHLLPVEEGIIMDYGYDDLVVFPFPVTIPQLAAGDVTLNTRVDYLICEEICIPEQVDVSLTLPVGDPIENVINGQLIADWIAKSPTDLPGEARIDTASAPWKLSLNSPGTFDTATSLRFFPFNHEIKHPAQQPVSRGPEGVTLSLTPDGDVDGTLDGVVVVEDTGGVRTGYALSAETGAVFEDTAGAAISKATNGGGAGGGSLVTWILFAFLGGLVLNLMPCVLPVLSMKALGMVSAAATGHAGEIRAHGVWYTIGVLISFAALAASIIGVRAATGNATLGFQLQHAPTVAVLSLIMFAIGLWLMGFFELGTSIQNTGGALANRGGPAGAFFTGVLAAIVGAPCVGPFLGAALGAVMSQPAPAVLAVFLAMGFGLALPFLLISFVPGLQKLLPKPGKWMVTLKQFFAFPMFLTMAWLLWVLGALAGSGPVAWTVAGATGVAFAVWLAQQGGAGAKALAAAALIAAFVLPVMRANTPAPVSGASTSYAAKYATEEWSPERVGELIAEGRPIFVDFTATWCATCQVNKIKTLKTKPVQEAFAANNVAFLVADFTRNDPLIAAELKLRERAGVPMYLWYAPGAAQPDILPELLSQELVIGLVEGS